MENSDRRSILRSGVSLVVGLAGCLTRNRTANETPSKTPPGAPIRWQYKTNGAVRQPPTVVGDIVHVPSDHLYALAAADGAEQWVFETTTPVQDSLTVTRGTVYAISGPNAGHPTERLHAVGRERGEQQWEFSPERHSRLAVLTATTTSVYLGTRDDNLGDTGESTYGLRTDDGTVQWRYETGDVRTRQAALGNGRLYVASPTRLYALDAETGTEAWRFEHRAGVWSPTFDDGTVYVLSEDGVHAIDAASGTVSWHFPTSLVPAADAMTVGTDHAFVGSFDGTLYAVDLNSGTKTWEVSTGGKIASAPAPKDDLLYLGSENTLHAIRATDGSQTWQFVADGDVMGAPRVSNGTVHLPVQKLPSRTEGIIHAVSAADGSERWTFAPGTGLTVPAVTANMAYVGSDAGVVYALDE